jgi:ferritin-like protein
VAARHGVQDKDVVIAFDEVDIKEEILEVLVATEASIVSKATLTKDKTEKKDTGTRSLVKLIIDSKVEIIIRNLLIGLGDTRRLLFSARE